MTTSTDNLQPGQQPASSASKALWAAVAILGVAVLGMGGTMIYNQRQSAPVATVVAARQPEAAPPVVAAPPQLAAPAASANAADDLIEKPAAAPAKPAPAPAKKVVKRVPKPAPVPEPGYSAPSPAPAPYATPYPSSSPAPVAAAAPVCAVCGSVESVTPVERSTKPAGPGAGAVAGGLLGGLLGNQVGHGGGRAAATLLGAVGGGFAGNAIEGQVRKEIVYQVGVRMEDGSRRTVEVVQAPSVGSRVTVEGATLRTQDGASYGPRSQ